jgi:hypothetical protein
MYMRIMLKSVLETDFYMRDLTEGDFRWLRIGYNGGLFRAQW